MVVTHKAEAVRALVAGLEFMLTSETTLVVRMFRYRLPLLFSTAHYLSAISPFTGRVEAFSCFASPNCTTLKKQSRVGKQSTYRSGGVFVSFT